MAKGKFDFLKSVNYGQDEQGRIRMFSDDQRNYFKAEAEARKKYEDAIKLKQQIQSETEAVIIQSQKEKAGFERMAAIGKGAQAVIDPRMWARGAVGLGKMVFGQTIETTVTGGRAIGEQNAATNLYNQSKDLADQAAKIVKTDRPQAEALLKQSQALAEEANKFSQGEATTKIMGADGKLTTKEIIGKSALTGLEVGSVLPIGGVARGSFMLSKTVPPAVQGTKTVAVGNAITRALGLGDVYQVTKTGLQQGLKQEVKQTIVGQAAKATIQAPVTAGLMEIADDDGVNNYMGSLLTTGAGAFGLTLGFGYAGRVLGGAASEVVSGVTQQLNKKSAAAVTDLTGAMPMPPAPVKPVPEPQKLLPLPQEAIQATTEVNSVAADKLYNQANKLSARASKLTDKTKADELIKKSQDLIAQADKMPKEKINIEQQLAEPPLDPNVFEPKAQVIGTTVNEPLPNPYSKLGAFNPETDIPMVDLTETIKANNIDFNPDSTISINATRKAVDDLALLTGNEVGGKKLKINTDDPKFKEIYNNQIKPLVDRINEVDAKVEAPSVKVDPLVEEARKYGSAEEFVNAQKKQTKEIDIYQEVTKLNKESIKNSAVITEQQKNSQLKGEGFRLSAIKRGIEGNPTYKEITSEQKRLNTFFKGKEVFVNNESVVVVGNSFGKIGVKYTNGDIKYLAKEDIKSPVYTKDDAIESIKEQSIAKLKSEPFYKQASNNLKTSNKENVKRLKEIYNQAQTQPDVSAQPQPAKDIITVYHGGTAGESPYKLHRDFFMTTSKKEAANYARRKHGEDGMITKIRVSKQDLQGPNDALIAKKGAELYLHEDGIYRLQPPSKQQTVEKVPVEDVEMEVQKIYSELENAGFNIAPEKVRYTPNIDKVDEKLARGEQLNPDEFNKGMQEYVNSTGKTEVIDGVQEELTNPMRKSTYVEKLKKENPDLNIESVLYEAAIVKDLEEKAINLIDTNFDEAGRIAKNITKSSNPQQVKVAELYMKKLLELGKNDEYAQLTHRFGKASSQAGQWNGILRPHKMGTPEYAIKQAQDTRINKLKPQVEKEVVKVKQQMSLIKVDQTFLFDILDNITCQ